MCYAVVCLLQIGAEVQDTYNWKLSTQR